MTSCFRRFKCKTNVAIQNLDHANTNKSVFLSCSLLTFTYTPDISFVGIFSYTKIAPHSIVFKLTLSQMFLHTFYISFLSSNSNKTGLLFDVCFLINLTRCTWFNDKRSFMFPKLNESSSQCSQFTHTGSFKWPTQHWGFFNNISHNAVCNDQQLFMLKKQFKRKIDFEFGFFFSFGRPNES